MKKIKKFLKYCLIIFLNVVILRTVSEESIVFPGSKCPKCQNKLKWYHIALIFNNRQHC